MTHIWTGKVDQGSEDVTVNSFFDGQGDVTRPLEAISMPAFTSLSLTETALQVLDPREDPKSMAPAPLPRAVRIPSRDLVVRGPIELNKQGILVLDCRTISAFDCQSMILGMRRQGFKRPVGLMMDRLEQSPACR